MGKLCSSTRTVYTVNKAMLISNYVVW